MPLGMKWDDTKVDGKMEGFGTWTRRNETGTSEYRCGKLHGLGIHINNSGHVTELVYDHGKLISLVQRVSE